MRSPSLRRSLAAAALAFACVAPAAQAIVPPAPAAMSSGLTAALAAAGPADELTVIVQLDADVSAAHVEALERAGLEVLHTFSVIPAVVASGTPAAIAGATRVAAVAYVEHDEPLQYHLDRSTTAVRAQQIWDALYTDGSYESCTGACGRPVQQGIDGRGVGIAIIDTGVDGRHPDLLHTSLADPTGRPAKTVENVKVALGVVDVDGITHTDATGGHGTHVAGIAAGFGVGSDGEYTGVAPGADIIGVSAGDSLRIHSALAGIDWVYRNHARYGIRVVNNSWGTSPGAYDPRSAVTKAVEASVREAGLVYVFSAGNSGGDGSAIATNPYANIPEAISVANYYDRTGWVDSSSSRGSKDDPATWPDLAAPGTQIIAPASAGGHVSYVGSGQDALIDQLDDNGEPIVVPAQTPWPVKSVVTTYQDSGTEEETVIVGDYASMTGTSMAAPAVAGVVALVLQANPDLAPAQVEELLERTANMPNRRSFAADGYAVGAGVADAAEAVAAALRMRTGLSMDDAIASAGLDLASSPARINLTPGPVTDNVVPLQPASPPTFTGQPHVYQAGLVDPFVLATDKTVTVAGVTHRLAQRSIESMDGSVPLPDPTAYTSSIEVRDATGALVAGPFAGNNRAETDGRGRFDADWTIPATLKTGSYRMVSSMTVTATGASYPLPDLWFRVLGAGT